MMHMFFEEALSLPCPPTAPNMLVHSGLPRSGRGAGVHGTVGCDVLGKKVVFKKLKIKIVIL